jgi:hypothetical protein
VFKYLFPRCNARALLLVSYQNVATEQIPHINIIKNICWIFNRLSPRYVDPRRHWPGAVSPWLTTTHGERHDCTCCCPRPCPAAAACSLCADALLPSSSCCPPPRPDLSSPGRRPTPAATRVQIPLWHCWREVRKESLGLRHCHTKRTTKYQRGPRQHSRKNSVMKKMKH